jgi:small subunit ribosomal protein S1
MSETPATEPAQTEDDLHNTLLEGTYVETVDDGYVFALARGGAEALVELEELGWGEGVVDGMTAELLVERKIGERWSASIRKAEKLRRWDQLVEMAEQGAEVEGLVTARNRGGLSVDIGVRAFVPRSQVDVMRVDDLGPYVGRISTFKVTEFDPEKAQVVLSRRKLLERAQKAKRKETLARIEEGAVFDGVVRGIKPYGAFVDVGGMEGLLHVSELSHGRIDHPSELLSVGDELQVVVLKYDKKRKRLSLGRKQLLADPWAAVADHYAEGDLVTGEVVSLADFGAFVAVEDGLEGLVHVTELAWMERIQHPRELLVMGQEVTAKIISLDIEAKRLGLSIKQLKPNPWVTLSAELSPGARFTGPIRNVTDFGLFVEAKPGIEGLVHVSNISWNERDDAPTKGYAVGDEVEVVVLSVDVEAERLELGIKQLTEDPWAVAAATATPGQKIPVEIVRIAEFGAFAQISEGVEGLIHVSEISEDRVDDVARHLRPGQKVDALVLSVDTDARRIALSLKRDQLEEDQIRSYSEEGGATATLGDLLRQQLGEVDVAPAEPVADPAAEEE